MPPALFSRIGCSLGNVEGKQDVVSRCQASLRSPIRVRDLKHMREDANVVDNFKGHNFTTLHYYLMEPTINSSIHLAVYFPMSIQNFEFVLVVDNHFDPVSRSVKDIDGNKVLVLDEDLFDTLFKCLDIDYFANLNIESAEVYYEKNSDKHKRNINDNW